MVDPYRIIISSHGVKVSLNLECLPKVPLLVILFPPPPPPSASILLLSLLCVFSRSRCALFLLLRWSTPRGSSLFSFSHLPLFILDQALRSTLDGRHWALGDPARSSWRSHTPAGSSAEALSRAPSKPRAPSPDRALPPPRVLFHPSSSSGAGAGSAPCAGYSAGPCASSSTDLSSADILSNCEGLDSTIVVHPPSPEHRSFVDDFLPLGLTGSDLLAGSSALLSTTASAVRFVLSSDTSRSPPVTSSAPPLTYSAAPPMASSAPPVPSSSAARPVVGDDLAPTRDQLQRLCAELQRQLDELAAQQTEAQRVRAIEEETENHRRAAYESAGIRYSPRQAPPVASPLPPRATEYRVSHKSIGYLHPAEASSRPFEAIEGETYVRPLAWLAHLRTKMELRDDFHYKNQVLQVASECLVGRAAAWWTAIGQRKRNILLTDYTLELWHQQMHVLCPSKEQTMHDALARTWQIVKEECWDYVWDKAALFEELDIWDRPLGVALISEILDGLPPTLARMCRTEFSVHPTVSDLTRELQVLVPRWHRDFDLRDRRREPEPRDRRRQPPLGSGPPHLTSGPPPLASVPVRAEAAPLERPSLSLTYDRSSIRMKPHPLTKAPPCCYTKPNGRTIFLSRNYSQCHEPHCDFEHDFLSPSAHFGLDEDGYDEWDWDSDTTGDDSRTKKLN